MFGLTDPLIEIIKPRDEFHDETKSNPVCNVDARYIFIREETPEKKIRKIFINIVARYAR